MSILPNVIADRADDRHALAVTLCFYCTSQTQSEFSREFLNTILARLPPLASAAGCCPHPPHLPRYATGSVWSWQWETRLSSVLRYRDCFIKLYRLNGGVRICTLYASGSCKWLLKCLNWIKFLRKRTWHPLTCVFLLSSKTRMIQAIIVNSPNLKGFTFRILLLRFKGFRSLTATAK